MKSPKLIDKWKDKYDLIDNYLYEYENGLRLVVSVNPKTTDFDYTVGINGGSYYERQVGVPQGTAHFLEHILFGSPNDLCKTEKELMEYTFGNRKRAGFYQNAYTSRKFIYIYAHGNYNAAERMLRYINAQVLFPLEKVKDFIEKERKIITNEIQRKPKEERDSGLQYDKFFWGDIYPEFAERGIGTVETVASVTVEDLLKYHEAIMIPGNMVLAVQLPSKPTKTIMSYLSDLASKLPSRKVNLKRNIIKYDPGFRHGYFHDPDNSSIFFSIAFHYELMPKFDYRRDRLYMLTTSLIRKIGYDYLRLEKHLVYSVDTFNDLEMINVKNRGLSIQTDKEKLLEVLDETYYMLYEYIDKFLDSASGKRWLDDIISTYLFRRNSEFDANYAEDIGGKVLDAINEYKFDYTKAKKAMMKIKTQDIKEFMHEFLEIVPCFWFNAPHPEAEIKEIFMQSKFYKRFADKERTSAN